MLFFDSSLLPSLSVFRFRVDVDVPVEPTSKTMINNL